MPTVCGSLPSSPLFVDTGSGPIKVGGGVAVGLFNDGVSDGQVFVMTCQRANYQSTNGGMIYKVTNTGGFDNTHYLAPAIPTPGTTPWLTVAAGASATALNIPAPTDNVYPSTALTITTDMLPICGTVTLSDGVTAVASGQSLTAAQLTGLKFKPNAGRTWSQSCHFMYQVANPFTIKRIGTASMTVLPSGLWADPAGTGTSPTGTITAPLVAQPSVTGDLVAWRELETLGTGTSAVWKTHSQVFQIGTLQPSDLAAGKSLMVRVCNPTCSSTIYAQVDQLSTWPDGSVKQVITTQRVPVLAANAHVDLLYAKCGGSFTACPVAPTAAPTLAATITALATTDITEAFSNAGITNFGNATTPTTPSSDTASAHNCLQSPGGPGVKQLLSGAVANRWLVFCNYLGNAIQVGFEITAYSDGTITGNLINSLGWGTTGGKSGLTYNYVIKQGTTQYYAENGVVQWMYSLGYRKVPGTARGLDNPTTQMDAPYWQAAGVFQDYDMSLGVRNDTSNTWSLPYEYNLVTTQKQSIIQTGDIVLDQGFPGSRPDIGLEPDWVAHYEITQDPRALVVLLAQTQGLLTLPIHLLDQSTNEVVNFGVGQSPGPSYTLANGAPCWAPSSGVVPNFICKDGQPWKPDMSHAPDAGHIPWLVTGEYVYLLSSESLALASEFGTATSTGAYQTPTSPLPDAFVNSFDIMGVVRTGLAAQDIFIPINGAYGNHAGTFVYNNSRQVRTVSWGRRNFAFAAFDIPDNSPLKNGWLIPYLQLTEAGAVQEHVADDINAIYGKIKGLYGGTLGTDLDTSGPNTYAINTLLFHERYGSEANVGIAKLNLPGASANATRLGWFMNQFQAGLSINGQQGFPPMNSTFYNADLTTAPASGQPFGPWQNIQNTFGGFYTVIGPQANMNVPPCMNVAGTAPFFCDGAQQRTFITNNPQALGGYGNIAGTANALNYNMLQTEDALHAWALTRTILNWEYTADFTSITGGRNPPQAHSPCWNFDGIGFPFDEQCTPQNSLAMQTPSGLVRALNTSATQFVNGATTTTTCSATPCTIGVLSTGAGPHVLNGQNSASDPDILLVSGTNAGTGGTSTFNAGTNDSRQYGGCGASTFVGGGGNDIIVPGANCYGTLATQTIQFGTNTTSKTKSIGYAATNGETIGKFRPGTDTLRIKTNLDGSTIKSAAQFAALCSVSGGDTVCSLSGGNTITLKGVTSSITSSVVIF